MPDERSQLWITGLSGKTLRVGDQALQARRSVLHLGRRLQITAGEVIGLAIMQAFITEEGVFRQGSFQPRGQSLDGGRGRRRHAAQ